MEPQTLEQLLDCPVCFERLDGTNRVLPCQHTFCKKCLEKVKSRFKELRCPECRFKYTGSISDLNCNILVMRILEQIKQSEKEALKSKNTSSLVKQSNAKTETEFSFPRTDRMGEEFCIVTHRMGHLEGPGKSSLIALPNGSPWDRFKAKVSRPDSGAVTQQASESAHCDTSSAGRIIIGATRKHSRPHEDGSNIRSSSIFASPIIPPLTITETGTHSVRGNEVSTFSPNSYTFTVELKSSDRNLIGNRRSNKNYVKPSILGAASNVSPVRSSGTITGNLFDAFVAATAAAASSTNSSAITSSASQSFSVFQSGPKNYLSFSPGSYTFNVNLKSNTDRGTHKKKNYLS